MLTQKLARSLNTVLKDMEISPELQDLWALPENREELIRAIRTFKMRAGHLRINTNLSEPERRGVPAPPIDYTTSRIGLGMSH